MSSLASSAAASAFSELPESNLLDLERPLDLDLDLDLDRDLDLLLLLLTEGVLDRDLEPDEVELLLLDLASSPSSISAKINLKQIKICKMKNKNNLKENSS